jgi:hypothetical protein
MVFTSMNVLRTNSKSCALGKSHGDDGWVDGVWNPDDDRE